VPKAYVMVMYRSAPEPTSFTQYGELAIPAVNEEAAEYSRGLPARTYEAGMNERVTLIEFDSPEQVIRARESSAYQAAFAKLGNVVRDVRIIEGS
jgi:uncharacterized protein (DUF1330 family)